MDPKAPTTYSGPGGSYWRDGVWHDPDGTPFPDLPEGMAWEFVQHVNDEFPEPIRMTGVIARAAERNERVADWLEQKERPFRKKVE